MSSSTCLKAELLVDMSRVDGSAESIEDLILI